MIREGSEKGRGTARACFWSIVFCIHFPIEICENECENVPHCVATICQPYLCYDIALSPTWPAFNTLYIPCICCMPYAVLTPTSHAYPIISFQHQRLILHSRQSEQRCVGNARSPGRQERHRGKVAGSAGLMKFLTQFTATTAKHNTEIEAEARRSCLPLSWSRRHRVTQGRSGRFDAIYAKTQPRRHRCLVVVRRRWAHLAATLHHKYATHLAIM